MIIAPLAKQTLAFERPDMNLKLDYLGYKDQFTGKITIQDSKRERDLLWDVCCTFPNGLDAVVQMQVHARSVDPNHSIKGTAKDNLDDHRRNIRYWAARWRTDIFDEQNRLHALCKEPVSKPIQMSLRRKPVVAYWVQQAIVYEPHSFGAVAWQQRWLEILPVGAASADVVDCVAQSLLSDFHDPEVAAGLARQGCSRAEIQRALEDDLDLL